MKKLLLTIIAIALTLTCFFGCDENPQTMLAETTTPPVEDGITQEKDEPPLTIDFNPDTNTPEIPETVDIQEGDKVEHLDELPDYIIPMVDAEEAATHEVVVQMFQDIETWIAEGCDPSTHYNAAEASKGNRQLGNGVAMTFTTREERTKFHDAIPNKDVLHIWRKTVYIIDDEDYFYYRFAVAGKACEIINN